MTLIAVPEPAGVSLLCGGFIALAMARVAHRRVFLAAAIAVGLTTSAHADIFRWDNGQLIPGTEGITPRPGI